MITPLQDHASKISLLQDHRTPTLTTTVAHDIISLRNVLPNSFDTIGSMHRTYTIYTDPNIQPVPYFRHKVLVEYRGQIEEKLQEIADSR